MAAVCPFFDCLPGVQQVKVLNDGRILQTTLDTGSRYAEDPVMSVLSGRLLIVAQKPL